jgi:hypothetical protein
VLRALISALDPHYLSATPRNRGIAQLQPCSIGQVQGGDTRGRLVHAQHVLAVTCCSGFHIVHTGFALQHGYRRIVQLSLLGSVVGNLLLVLGTAFIAGGVKQKHQTFNQQVRQQTQGGHQPTGVEQHRGSQPGQLPVSACMPCSTRCWDNVLLALPTTLHSHVQHNELHSSCGCLLFHTQGINVNCGLLLLATVAVMLPSLLSETKTQVRSAPLSVTHTREGGCQNSKTRTWFTRQRVPCLSLTLLVVTGVGHYPTTATHSAPGCGPALIICLGASFIVCCRTQARENGNASELLLSRFESVFLLVCYGCYLLFQLYTHRYAPCFTDWSLAAGQSQSYSLQSQSRSDLDFDCYIYEWSQLAVQLKLTFVVA